MHTSKAYYFMLEMHKRMHESLHAWSKVEKLRIEEFYKERFSLEPTAELSILLKLLHSEKLLSKKQEERCCISTRSRGNKEKQREISNEWVMLKKEIIAKYVVTIAYDSDCSNMRKILHDKVECIGKKIIEENDNENNRNFNEENNL